MNLSNKGVGLLLSVMILGTIAHPSTVVSAQEEGGARGELLDGIIAVVGDHVVTRSELAQALAFPAALLKALLNRRRK